MNYTPTQDNPRKMATLRRLSAAVTLFWLFGSSVVFAQNQESQPDKFPNPLEMTTPDPLLPQSTEKRPLSPLERKKLIGALNELNAQATSKLQAGDRQGAFEIWNRELRLRRALGPLEEVEALGRVGAIAWRENQRPEVQVITQRLQAIQQQSEKSQRNTDLKLQQALGQAYQQVRSPKLALEIYNQILAQQRQQQDAAAVEATLRTIAELNLSWFDYPAASASYKELLGSARKNGDRISEVNYLQQLAYIYGQARQYELSAKTKQQLLEIYLNEQQLERLPALRLAIGADYESLKQVQEAFRSYQEAYTSAWSLQQYFRAGEALRRLIRLYRSGGQIDAALQTLQTLLQADRLASNFYGLIDTYDQIGQIYLRQGKNPEALAAFQQGLEVAQQLKYRENYFTKRINQLSQQID